MGEAAQKLEYTFEEYIALEEKSALKHELLNGELFPLGEVLAMAGGTPEHGRLTMQMGRLLGNALHGRPCVVLSSDVRVRVRATGFTAYPDVSVVCGAIERDPQDRNTVLNPVVIVEVLSDSTEAHDRSTKLKHYRKLASLRDYLLVDQHQPYVEHYRRNDDGSWSLVDVAPPDALHLSIGVELPVAEIYDNPLGTTGS